MSKTLAVVLSIACVTAWFSGIFVLAAVSGNLGSIILFSIPAYLATMLLAWLLFFCRVMSSKSALNYYLHALVLSLAAPAAFVFIAASVFDGAPVDVLFAQAVNDVESTAVHASLAYSILSPFVFVCYSLVKIRRFSHLL